MQHLIIWTSDKAGFFAGPVRWGALPACTQLIFSYLVLNLLRNTLQLQAAHRIAGIAADDQHELRVIGSANMLGGVFGSFGTITNLGVTATCVGFGETHRAAPGVLTGGLLVIFCESGGGVVRDGTAQH